MTTKKAVANVEKWIEWLLLQSSFSIPKRDDKFNDGIKKPKFKWFNPAFLLLDGLDWLTDENYGFYKDATPAALDGPPQNVVAVATELADSTCDPTKAFQIHHFRVAPAEAWRGKPYYMERYMLTVYMFWPEAATWYSSTLFISKVNGKYVNVSRHGENSTFKVGEDLFPYDASRKADLEDKDSSLDMQIRLQLGCQFTSEYFWHADIGWDGHPKIRLPMTADRALRLFALRDVPTEEQRRKALLHWITGHVRVLNRGEEDEKIVRVIPHIKGVYDFGWNGLNVSVYPSMSVMRDLKKQQGAKITETTIVHDRRIEEAKAV
jgi:hypothetical protein